MVIELYHSGIKGQKWGVRRYQNPDGSLTEEGKLRYNQYKNDLDKNIREVTHNIYKRDYMSNNMPRGSVLSGVVDSIDKRINKLYSKGQQIARRMQQEGLMNPNTSYDDLRISYEREIATGYLAIVNLSGIEITESQFQAYMMGETKPKK